MKRCARSCFRSFFTAVWSRAKSAARGSSVKLLILQCARFGSRNPPRLVQPGDMRIKHMNCKIIWSLRPDMKHIDCTWTNSAIAFEVSGASIVTETSYIGTELQEVWQTFWWWHDCHSECKTGGEKGSWVSWYIPGISSYSQGFPLAAAVDSKV